MRIREWQRLVPRLEGRIVWVEGHRRTIKRGMLDMIGGVVLDRPVKEFRYWNIDACKRKDGRTWKP